MPYGCVNPDPNQTGYIPLPALDNKVNWFTVDVTGAGCALIAREVF